MPISSRQNTRIPPKANDYVLIATREEIESLIDSETQLFNDPIYPDCHLHIHEEMLEALPGKVVQVQDTDFNDHTIKILGDWWLPMSMVEIVSYKLNYADKL